MRQARSSYANPRKGMAFLLDEREQASWQRFLETGSVSDYLRYRRQQAQQEENPRRRIQNATKNRNFY